MALLVLASAGLLYFAIMSMAPLREEPPETVVERSDRLPEPVTRHHEFAFWLSVWSRVIPDLRAEEFALAGESGIDFTLVPASLAPRPEPADLAVPRTNRYVYSPDGERFVNYLARYGESTSAVTFYDPQDGVLRTLRTCAKPCRFDHAFWITDSLAVVLGITEANPGGGAQCPAGNWRTCPGRLTVDVYDFAARAQLRYLSGQRIISEDPFEALARQRWLSSLTEAEKAVLAPEGNVTQTGTLVSKEDGDLLVAVAEGKTIRVTLLEETVIVDERGTPVDRTYLQPGFALSLEGRPADGDAFFAARIAVAAAPNVIVYEPRPDAEVGLAFAVSGIARAFENTVQLRLRNLRSGRTLVETFATADAAGAGLYGRFVAELSIPSGRVRSGDPLALDAFQYSAEDGSEIDLVTVPLRYSP